MEGKRILKALLFPPLWITVSLSVLCAAGLIFVFAKGCSETVPSYFLYALSFYALCVVCARLWVFLPRGYKRAKGALYANTYGNRYLSNAAYRTGVSLHLSLGINLLYVGVNAVSFVLYRSSWFVILAVYYAILAAMRFLLVKYIRATGIGKNRRGELKRATVCSFILLLTNFSLTGSVLMMLYRDKGFAYPGLLIYAMAAYTFYITVYAIVSLVRYRKYASPVMMTSKVISLSAALVSLLALETAMLSQFGQDMAAQNKRLFIALTGAAVSVVIVTLAVVTIVLCIKELKNGTDNGKQKHRNI